MTTISAKTILRSRNAVAPQHVLSTLLLRYPRCIHAEFMTHRVFSRNAASSRAIPVKKLIDDVLADPFVPLFWGKNIAGMQAREELSAYGKQLAHDTWMGAMEDAIYRARQMEHLHDDEDGKGVGAHKQIVNRLLEPFSHITVVVSATEWSNFLALRDHSDAEPHIAMLARGIRKCLEDESTIQTLQPWDWHLPFVEQADIDRLTAITGPTDHVGAFIKLAVSRCASTSYKTVEGFDMTMERAIALHDKLVASTPLHASPCEHVAQADEWGSSKMFSLDSEAGWRNSEQHKNFVGFRQYRAMLPNECL